MRINDFIVLGIILVLVTAAVFYMAKQKQKGKRFGCGSCSGNCAGCAGKRPEK